MQWIATVARATCSSDMGNGTEYSVWLERGGCIGSGGFCCFVCRSVFVVRAEVTSLVGTQFDH